MDEQVLALLNTAMQLVQRVQKDVDSDKLDKSFWVTVGMFYQGYKSQMDKIQQNTVPNPPSQPPGAVVFKNKQEHPDQMKSTTEVIPRPTTIGSWDQSRPETDEPAS